MNAFEKGLRRGIPIEKAASFFYDLKHKGRVMAPEDDALMAESVKQAAMTLAPVKTAAQRFDDIVASCKTAGDDGMPAGADALPSPQPGKSQDPSEYLANEQAAQEGEDSASLLFYQQKLEEARAQTAQDAQEKAELQGQVEQLTQQQEQHDTQLAASQQEIQIAGQAAVQQVNSANQMASQAMQSAVEASNQALQAKATETTAKIQGQQLRTQLFDLASTGLPGTEPDLGGAGNPAEGLEPTGDIPPPGGAEGGAVGEDGGAAVGGGGEGPAGGGQEDQAGGDSGADGSAGAPTSAMNTEGEPATADGTTGADGAVGAAAAPGSVPPGGGGPDAPPQANATSGSSGGGGSQAGGPVPGAKPAGQVSIKVGFDVNALRAQRAPTKDQLAKCAAALPSYLRDPKIIGALAGGITGAGAAGLEASGHGPDLGKLQGKIDAGEQAAREPGVKGFAKAFELAKDKALHTLGTATQNHPVAATLTGGLLGAGVGYGAGPEVGKLVGEAVQSHKG